MVLRCVCPHSRKVTGNFRRPQQPALLVAFAVGYLLLNILSLSLGSRANFVAVFWPASGVAAAAVYAVRSGDRGWVVLAVFVDNSLANVLHGSPVGNSLGFGVANAVETTAFAALFVPLASTASGITKWGRFVASVAGSVAVGSVVAATVVAAGHRGVSFPDAAQTWFVADAVGMIVVAPMLMFLPDHRAARARLARGGRSARPWLEVAAVLLGLTLEIAYVFGQRGFRPLAFLVLPALIAAGLWLGRLATAWLVGATAVVCTLLTLDGRGPFGSLAQSTSSQTLQIFIATTALAALTLAIAVEDGRRANRHLSEQEQLFRRNFDDALVGMIVLDHDPNGSSRIVRANTSARLALQLPGGALMRNGVDLTWAELLPPDEQPQIAEVLTEIAQGQRETWQGEVEHVVGQERRWLDVSLATMKSDAEDDTRHLTLQLVDVTARKVAEAALTEMAMHDSLTGLPNRTLLLDRLSLALAAASRHGHRVGVLFLDLDDFKTINDALGHHVGDVVLQEIARRLSEAVRPGDTVSRMGGDEFIVLCPDLPDIAAAQIVADRILSALTEPVLVGDRSWSVEVSVGIALAEHGDSADTVLREADSAMYAAKRKGKGRAEVFQQEMHVRAARQANLAPRLRQALADGEFRLHFQPIVDLESSMVVGAEALIRWAHPTRGLLPPGEWLDVVEKSDLVVAMGRWVLQEACRIGAMWQETLGDRAPIIHANVSARHLNNVSFFGDVRQALHDSGCSPQWLVLEVTETHLLTVSHSLRRDLERLRTIGVKLAADDYGTGYSALSQIVELDVDVIKIDKSFVMAMDSSRRAHAVVQAVVGLSKALGLEVVAEGVERPEHAAELLRMGCLSGQGYLWSPARPAEDIAAMLRDGRVGRDELALPLTGPRPARVLPAAAAPRPGQSAGPLG